MISPLQLYPNPTTELCFTGIYYRLLLEQSFSVILLAISSCLTWFSSFIRSETECFGIIWRKFLTGQMLFLWFSLLCLLLMTIFQLNLGEPFPHVAFLLLFHKITFAVSGFLVIPVSQSACQSTEVGFCEYRTVCMWAASATPVDVIWVLALEAPG